MRTCFPLGSLPGSLPGGLSGGVFGLHKITRLCGLGLPLAGRGRGVEWVDWGWVEGMYYTVLYFLPISSSCLFISLAVGDSWEVVEGSLRHCTRACLMVYSSGFPPFLPRKLFSSFLTLTICGPAQTVRQGTWPCYFFWLVTPRTTRALLPDFFTLLGRGMTGGW